VVQRAVGLWAHPGPWSGQHHVDAEGQRADFADTSPGACAQGGGSRSAGGVLGLLAVVWVPVPPCCDQVRCLGCLDDALGGSALRVVGRLPLHTCEWRRSCTAAATGAAKSCERQCMTISVVVDHTTAASCLAPVASNNDFTSDFETAGDVRVDAQHHYGGSRSATLGHVREIVVAKVESAEARIPATSSS
jgi:hypothetical protein